MRRRVHLLRAAILCAAAGLAADPRAAAAQPEPRVVTVRPGADLRPILETLDGPARVELLPGRHALRGLAYIDPTCGNCEDPNTSAQATLGIRVTGHGIRLSGSSPDSVLLETNAGYGILFEDCEGCGLSGLTVTGGMRDPDGNATDAAIVVRRSTVTIEDCAIRDNIGDSATVAAVVVGVAGIAGREGGGLTVRRCRITRNSWDGIALYRGARAVIRDNVVDGVDRAAGSRIGGGRGVGIGVTWDAQAVIEGNLVTRYWKGIGIFVNARAHVRENVVEDVLTWGIAYWDAGSGRPVALVEHNAIFRTGACGASITRADEDDPSPGTFSGNALVETGGNSRYDDPEYYCRQEALAEHAVPPGFAIRDNLFLANREAGGEPGSRDLSRREFSTRVRPLVERLRARPALRQSLFLREFGEP